MQQNVRSSQSQGYSSEERINILTMKINLNYISEDSVRTAQWTHSYSHKNQSVNAVKGNNSCCF